MKIKLQISRALAGTCLILALSAVLSGCNQDTYRDSAAQQAVRAAQLKEHELTPVVGKYCGTMHMIASAEDYDVTINLTIERENVHSSASQDPTDTVQIPKLVGNMRFPAIDNLGSAIYESDPELIAATGGYGSVSFTYGDYVPETKRINMPFAVAGHGDGNYGAIDGTFDNGQIKGEWDSISFEHVGDFEVAFCNGK
jgi:hypothetical protein